MAEERIEEGDFRQRTIRQAPFACSKILPAAVDASSSPDKNNDSLII